MKEFLEKYKTELILVSLGIILVIAISFVSKELAGGIGGIFALIFGKKVIPKEIPDLQEKEKQLKEQLSEQDKELAKKVPDLSKQEEADYWNKR